MINNCWQKCLWDSGLVEWFSLRVREVPGSIPGCPLRRISKLICPKNAIFLLLVSEIIWKTVCTTDDKKLINWRTLIINCWQPSLWDSALEVRFSLWKPEVTGSINGCPQLRIIELIGPNNSISWVIFHFWEIIWKTVCKTDYEKYKLEHYDYQLLTIIFMGQCSSGMILG